MNNGFSDRLSTPIFIPMKMCEIDELDLPPMNDEEWPNLDQPWPNPIPKDVAALWTDLELSNIDEDGNDNDPFTSCIDPQLLTREFHQPYQPPRTPDLAPQYVGSGPYQPSPTPEPAPQYENNTLPLDYHNKRADWHRAAEQFHRDQAQDLAALLQLFDHQEPALEQPTQGTSEKNYAGSSANGGVLESSTSRTVLPKADIRGLKVRQYQPERLPKNGRVQKMMARSPRSLPTGTKVSNNSPKRPLLWKNSTPATFRAKPPASYMQPRYQIPSRRQSGFVATQWTEPPPASAKGTDEDQEMADLFEYSNES